MTFICIGRTVPKELADLGWVERSAMHLGHGVWIISLDKMEEKQPFDRTAYMREYMRKKRAEK